ncbi:MAG: AraC family transcriptional regulator [Kiritimatiellales bacterium]
MDKLLTKIKEPADYFKGLGEYELPLPVNILMYLRTAKNNLQQQALQNRSHHRYVLAFCLKTSGHVHVDNLTLPLRPSDALLIFPYQFHHFSHLESVSLQWLFSTFELRSTQNFLEPLRNRTIHVGDASLFIREQMLKYWLECSSLRAPAKTQLEQLQTTLLSLLISLKQDFQRASPETPPEIENSLLRSINTFMYEWRGRVVTIEDIAGELKLSESYLRILFKRTAGISLGSYIQNYRINRAMALLSTTGFSIADIAEEAGFGSLQAFSRAFKNKTGRTPREYRRQI